MFELFLPAALSIVKYIMLITMFIAFKKWIVIGISLVAAFFALKGLHIMLEFFKQIMGNTILRWVIGLSLIFGVGGLTGYCSRPVPPPNKVVKEILVQKKEEGLRSTALIRDGKTYYNQDMINKYLKAHGLEGTFKNLA